MSPSSSASSSQTALCGQVGSRGPKVNVGSRGSKVSGPSRQRCSRCSNRRSRCLGRCLCHRCSPHPRRSNRRNHPAGVPSEASLPPSMLSESSTSTMSSESSTSRLLETDTTARHRASAHCIHTGCIDCKHTCQHGKHSQANPEETLTHSPRRSSQTSQRSSNMNW
jgi:hypothetical protein